MRAALVLGGMCVIICASGWARADEGTSVVAPLGAPRAGPSAGLLGGYGLQISAVTGWGHNAYRAGFGGRVGMTFPFHLYLGGALASHLGANIRANGDGQEVYDAAYHVSYGGPEAGYDLYVGPVLLRPYAGAGVLAAVGHTTVRGVSTGGSTGYFYVAPGVLAAYPIRRVLVGLDLRMPLVPGLDSKQWAPTAMLSLGTALPL